MAVKYPEFNELKKESAFDWLVKSEGESFTKNKAIIRFDMFTQNRKVSISNDMKKAILTLLKKYVDAEQTSYADVTINVELQKVFDRNSKRKPKTEIYYILCVTIKKMNGETCNLKQWKADSYSGDFENKISNIYMHQMNDKIGNKFMWRFIKKYLDKQMTELYSGA